MYISSNQSTPKKRLKNKQTRKECYNQWFSTRVNPAPQVTFGNVWRYFWCRYWRRGLLLASRG